MLGRAPDADVLIEAVGVSRRHAAIVVDDDLVTLRDLASKNGTFVDGNRATTPVQLHDNAEIRLGAVRLIFRRANLAGPTQTVDGTQEPRAMLNHPHIVTLHSPDEHDGVLFLTMELLEGSTLSDVVPIGGLPIERFQRMAVELADATRRDRRSAPPPPGPCGSPATLPETAHRAACRA